MRNLSDKICYIVGAADFREAPNPTACDFIIAADGGYDKLKKIGITPNLLIGDMDSISEKPNGVELLKFKVEKDETDTHLALLEGERRGYRNFLIYGGAGGRSDHTFANFSTLLFATRRGLCATLVADEWEAIIIENGKVEIPYGKYDGVSVFAFAGDAVGVTVAGAKYNCDNITLTADFPLGVSNSFLGEAISVEVRRGALLIILRR